MTDIMKLADDYARSYMSFGEPSARAALQSAIEALQGEVESLRKEAATQEEYIERAVEFISAERDALQAENEWLQGALAAKTRGYEVRKAERDALAAKLDAAPKALEPLTDEQILEAIRNAPQIPHTYAGWVRDMRIAWGRAILAAAHGITKGTPT